MENLRANELRLGNYVLDRRKKAIKADIDALIIIDNWENATYTKVPPFTPIPLTGEWLIRFGFQKINHIHGYSFYSLSKSKINKCHIDIYEDKRTNFMGHPVVKCDFVHQLQNLYFCLTGKELILQP